MQNKIWRTVLLLMIIACFSLWLVEFILNLQYESRVFLSIKN